MFLVQKRNNIVYSIEIFNRIEKIENTIHTECCVSFIHLPPQSRISSLSIQIRFEMSKWYFVRTSSKLRRLCHNQIH